MLLIALILNLDILIEHTVSQYMGYVIHCCVEGMIVLMFSRELRGHS